MEKMEIDNVVDLSIGSGRDELTITPSTARDLRALTQNSSLTITPALPPLIAAGAQVNQQTGSRRVLRPREVRSYAEAPDIVLLPSKVNGRPNGSVESDDEEDSPMSLPIKELSAAEVWERERGLRKLREELRCEETKLVLLKKLKQSQQMMKENLIVTPSNPSQVNNPLASLPVSLTKSLSVTPTTAVPLPAHSKNKSTTISALPGRLPSLNITATKNGRPLLPGGATLTPSGQSRGSSLSLTRTGSNLTITPSVTITPTSAPSSGSKSRNLPTGSISNSVSITPAPSITCNPVEQIPPKIERSSSRDDGQTQAQRQAAAKLALRKQLEKTLLQIPPPKPPAPEMNFIPNPNNTEFVYLLGLEHVVDYLTKDRKGIQPQQPYRCTQCKIDFTPVWKWEKVAGKEPKVICEQCVTTNAKKALKAEHTNRLKTAFVKALQQEQEIEQLLAAQSSPSPVAQSSPSTLTPVLREEKPISHHQQQQQQQQQQHQQQQSHHQQQQQVLQQQQQQQQQQHQQLQQQQHILQQSQQHIPQPIKSQTPTPRPTPTPPSLSTPPPASSSRSRRHDSAANAAALAAQQLSAVGGFANLTNPATAAAAMQAFQQQLFRGLQQGLQSGNLGNIPAQFSPLLYSYQLAMAQAVAAGKGPSITDMQRAIELQRQYLEMFPQAPGSTNSRSNQNNWKS
uniref:Putative simjang n=1 Tax=Corethrella appendiculata TaxID=1370023 RepID=U5ERD8_9DIPT